MSQPHQSPLMMRPRVYPGCQLPAARVCTATRHCLGSADARVGLGVPCELAARVCITASAGTPLRLSSAVGGRVRDVAPASTRRQPKNSG